MYNSILFYLENTMDCAYVKPENHQSTLLTVAYVMAGICAFCLFPIVIIFIYWQIKRCQNEEGGTEDINNTTDVRELLKDESTDR